MNYIAKNQEKKDYTVEELDTVDGYIAAYSEDTFAIIFTRYNSDGEIVETSYKVFYGDSFNEYEFCLKGGEKLVVSNLPGGELIQYKVEEIDTKGYVDTYVNAKGKVSLYGDPVTATVKNYKHKGGGGVPPFIPEKPPKTGDASVLGYSIMAVMAALGVMGSRRKK